MLQEDPADAGSESGTKLLFTFGNPRGERRSVELAKTYEDQGEALFTHGQMKAALKRVTDT